jgi:DMSO/TMAO reductase YedYZ molybdopterin-dependent catalytic subunit
MNTDSVNPKGLYLGLLGIGMVAALNGLAHFMAWKHPRIIQHTARAVVTPVMRSLLGRTDQHAVYTREDISPFFWVNGRMPTCDEWKTLAASDFKNYRLKVVGNVENPVELSIDDMRELGLKSQITLHHCIQGWSGIAEWGGFPLAELMKLVRPTKSATAVVFYSFSEGLAENNGEVGGQYYDSLTLENAENAQTILAYEMNYQPLTQLHGAPLRLRVENQLGFKMVKWISKIEFVEDIKSIKRGEGGYAEDNEYFGELANI